MAQRPYWTGQIKLSLVMLPVQIYSATQSSTAQIDLDMLDRNTGERVHYKNVLEDGTPVEREDIIKGYEISKGNYVHLEPEEIQGVKLPSSDVFELEHFVDLAELPLPYIEKPFYVVPNGKNAQEIYGVIRDALKSTQKAGLGQITIRGKEELCALIPYENGLLVETLRYAPEVRDSEDFYTTVKAGKSRGEYLDLAKKLMEKNSGEFKPAMFKDHYYEALMELINSKKQKRKPQYKVAEAPPDKVINLMDALRGSLNGGKKSKATTPKKKPPKNKSQAKSRKPAKKRA